MSLTARGRTIATLVALVAMAVGVVVAVRIVDLPAQLSREGCDATVDGDTVHVDLEQAHAASLIGATAVARGLPARAATIALATAYQESDLRNVAHGDRDSLGLFQQRPSQGWGTAEQVQDPVYATNAFYDALVEVDGYRDMEITVAAQAVQRSGFPSAYSDHEADARVLASAFTGYSPAALSCTVHPSDDAREDSAAGLAAREQGVIDAAQAVFGPRNLGDAAARGADGQGADGQGADGQEADGQVVEGQVVEGQGVDFLFTPGTEAAQVAGWAQAHWLVANADLLGITTVGYDARVWTVAKSDAGWQPYEPPIGPTDDPSLLHRDAVHVEVR